MQTRPLKSIRKRHTSIMIQQDTGRSEHHHAGTSVKKALINHKMGRSLSKLGWVWCLCLVGGLLASACTFKGSRQPIAFKFTYFSYLNGDDIRSQCAIGGSDILRFVYNGIYTEQVRTYDLVPNRRESGLFVLETRVRSEADFSSIKTDLSWPDLFAPWRPVESLVKLSTEDVQSLKRALTSSGFFGKPVFLGNVSSIRFYWLVSGCIEGTFHLRAFVWPEDAFHGADFPKLLSSWDRTGIPVNPPRTTSLFQVYGTTDAEEHPTFFTIRVGENRIN